MQSTQKQPTNFAADPSSSPAAILRRAAIYLWAYGWTNEGFYDRSIGEDIPFPPACVAGAIRCAVFGRTIDSLWDEIVDPAHDLNAQRITAAQAALADEVDPEWWVESTCTDKSTCALEVISDWNDVDGRTISQVLIALYGAADYWDATHPYAYTAVGK